MAAKPYITINDNGSMIVRCMNCNDSKNPIVENGRIKSHHTVYPVILEDTSVANLQICVKCLVKITENNYPDLEETMYLGWETELKQKAKKDNTIDINQILTKLKKGKKIVGKSYKRGLN